MNYVANKFVMLFTRKDHVRGNNALNRVIEMTRLATQALPDVRSQGVQQSKHANLSQPAWAQGLRVVCRVKLLTKGMTISLVGCLASHPANLMCEVMRTDSVLP